MVNCLWMCGWFAEKPGGMRNFGLAAFALGCFAVYRHRWPSFAEMHGAPQRLLYSMWCTALLSEAFTFARFATSPHSSQVHCLQIQHSSIKLADRSAWARKERDSRPSHQQSHAFFTPQLPGLILFEAGWKCSKKNRSNLTHQSFF